MVEDRRVGEEGKRTSFSSFVFSHGRIQHLGQNKEDLVYLVNLGLPQKATNAAFKICGELMTKLYTTQQKKSVYSLKYKK
jgi:hypothetical protein